MAKVRPDKETPKFTYVALGHNAPGLPRGNGGKKDYNKVETLIGLD